MQDSSLPIVAQKWGVNWKLLAKVNKIKSPYVVIKGQKILAPPNEKKKK